MAAVGKTYRTCVDRPVLGPSHDVSLAADEEAVGKGGILGFDFTADDGGDGLHLFGLELFPGTAH